MAKGSQGILIRRESSVAGTTAALSTNTISFNGTGNEIGRQAGFADFSTGMVVYCDASLNTGYYTIKTTDTTHVHVREAITDQASGVTINLTGHAMQNVGQVVSFNGPAITAAVIDVTTLQSTAKEKLISIYDGGQVSLGLIWDNEASNTNLHDALVMDMQAKTQRKFNIQIVGGSTAQTQNIHFGGYVSGFNPTGSVDNALKADVSIALSSGVAFSTNTATA